VRRLVSALSCLVLFAGFAWTVACTREAPGPSVAIVEVPPVGEGGPEKMARMAGRVDGAHPGDAVILFTKTNVWYVQPFRKQPVTTIQPDGTWSALIHLGSDYAALLVRQGYQPPPTYQTLPQAGADVLAIATVHGAGDASAPATSTIAFGGYEWNVRQRPSERGGFNQYADNARTDADGALHLTLTRKGDTWTSAEVVMTRSLGYGTYAFVIRDLTGLDPAAMLTLFTYDESGPPDSYREMDIQIQRPDPQSPVAGQYVLQPYYVAANLARFAVPSGPSTYSFRWEAGRVVFVTAPGRRPQLHGSGAAEHEFTVGVPTPGQERIGINLSYFKKSPAPPQRDVEVVIERFQYFP
jgi:hypothetical protein